VRIAFIGTRGIPASYSGFETFVEQLGTRLVERGHEVTVYCRRHHFAERPASYRAMRLTHLGGIKTKHLDTITHTAVSCIHAMFRRPDIVVMCISGNSPLALLPRLAGSKVVLNVDGSDWRRRKWGWLARAYIRFSEWLAIRLPDATVTDSDVMQRYYRERLTADTECIAYGAELPPPDGTDVLERLGLSSRGYILLVGRMVPENRVEHLVDAYQRLDTPLKCVVVGDAPYADDYKADLRRRGPGVIFTGYIFGDGYRQLMHHAHVVVLCSEVGGTHPVLVVAMAAGICVVVNDTPANLEVVDSAGVPYSGVRGAEALEEVLSRLEQEPGSVAVYRRLALERAASHYSWEVVTDQYEKLFSRLLGRGRALADPTLSRVEAARGR
jgi:glycosyltransferase involved in cell wall biosynthesis